MDGLKTPWGLFGVECAEGWYPLIKPILEYIEDYNKDKTEENKTVVYQIKEKWGMLSIQVGNCTEELYKMIKEAEKKSKNICEECGASASLRKYNDWYITLCNNCLTEKQKKRTILGLRSEINLPDSTNDI